MEGREEHKCKHKNPLGAYILCWLSGSYARDLGKHDRVLKIHDRVLRGDARILRTQARALGSQARVLSCTRECGTFECQEFESADQIGPKPTQDPIWQMS